MDKDKLCFACLNAYHRIHPDSFFKRPLKAKERGQASKSMVFVAFSELAGRAKDEKDYFFILRAIDRDPDRIYRMLAVNEDDLIWDEIGKLRKEREKGTVEKFLRHYREEKAKL